MIDKFCDPNALPSNQRTNGIKVEKSNVTANSQQQKRINLQSLNHNNIKPTIQNNNNNNNNNNSNNNNNNNINNNNNDDNANSINGNGIKHDVDLGTHDAPRANDSQHEAKANILPYPQGPLKHNSPSELNPPTPSIFVQSEAEIFSPQLQEFCLAHPIAVIRNISRVLKLNLGLFSTKTLVDLDAGHSIEVRTQLEQPSDENWDHEKKLKIWRCESPRAWSKIGRYAQYQARTFQNHLTSKTRNSVAADIDFTINDEKTSIKKNPHFKFVTFGTNVDLSDSKKWKGQLDELDKLPMFSRVVSASNMLSHIGHPILGMNTVQLYMKVPGCRTPGHQENNNFCSVNINIGPGDCEWFGVPEEYWGPMARLCAENNTNFVHGSWWPNLDDLHARNIPVYRFIQKPGDLVWVNTGTVHWVQAIGWCNNIAWNVGPITTKQFKSAIERYEWNKVERYKSIVPMIHLTWNLVRNIEIHDEELFHVIKNFMATTLSYCERIIKMLEDSNIDIKWHGKAPHEPAHYCANCEIEVFNILFVKSIEKKLVVHCAKCAIEVSQILESFVVLQEYDMAYLKETYSNFIRTFRNQQQRITNTTTTVATTAATTTTVSPANSLSKGCTLPN
uniref:Lysine-specific demethylase 6A n=1 Tax=Aceria tosichella TaxID=561515 RepID=A0A6G1S536_9ACAR